jgi:peptide/nickel transport system ATP-binding protein
MPSIPSSGSERVDPRQSPDEPRNEPRLSVRDLTVTFPSASGSIQATDKVSFDILPRETLALVGESGCGKSVTAMSILNLLGSQRGTVQEGRVLFEGRDVLSLPGEELRRIRGNRIAMIFQEPMSSLNPVFTIGSQIAEPLILHKQFSEEQARQEAIRLLRLVGIPAPERRVDEYPHQMSGGMRQRAMIAMAVSCRPSLLIADEPTTALDVTVQAQILDLLALLQAELGMSILLITHDLSLVASAAHRAIVMYAGRVVEEADVFGLFERPRHPYTAGLFESLPHLGTAPGSRSARLRPIEGSVPDAHKPPPGCRFHPRCRYAFAPCSERVPVLSLPRGEPALPRRLAACWYTDEHPAVDYLDRAPSRVGAQGGEGEEPR